MEVVYLYFVDLQWRFSKNFGKNLELDVFVLNKIVNQFGKNVTKISKIFVKNTPLNASNVCLILCGTLLKSLKPMADVHH